MNTEDKKYLIDTDENKKFLEDVRNGLLKFGHAFHLRVAGLITLAMMVHHGKIATVRPGLPAVWLMYIVLALS